MDRRDNSETTGNLTDEQLRSALKVIIDSYSGAPSERIHRDAIVCFEGLIEISHNTDAILDFARRHDIDNKYLVDGANFVISGMHFNPEGNYYTTMGLPRNVSPEEIRERWKRLMLLYHPDRQGGDESWVSERAKKVNEAYSELKDREKREAFDRKLLEQEMTERSALRTAPVQRKAHSAGSGRKISQDPEWDRKKRKIPMLLVGVYLVGSILILGYIYLQNNAEHIENALSRKDGPPEQAGLTTGAEAGKENTKAIKAEGGPIKNMVVEDWQKSYPAPNPDAAVKRTELPGDTRKPVPALLPARSASDSRQNETAPGKENDTASVVTADESARKKTFPVWPMQSSTPAVSPQTDRQETTQRSSVLPVKEMPAAGVGVRPPEPPAAGRQEAAASRHPEQSGKPDGISREEVEEFMKRYCAAYLKGDLRTFMSFFSRAVVENNKLRYNEVRDAYRDTFSEKINSYRINNMSITLSGQNAVVSGVYDLSRYASAEDRWVRYSGKIQWKLTKENNELKIISSNYDK